MATELPRVNVSLSPALHDLVRDLAYHRGVSMSYVLRELLEHAEPALRHLIDCLDHAERAPGVVLQGFAESLTRSQAAIDDILFAQTVRHERAAAAAGGPLPETVPGPGETDQSAQPHAGCADGRVNPQSARVFPMVNPRASNRGVRSVDKSQKRPFGEV